MNEAKQLANRMIRKQADNRWNKIKYKFRG